MCVNTSLNIIKGQTVGCNWLLCVETQQDITGIFFLAWEIVGIFLWPPMFQSKVPSFSDLCDVLCKMNAYVYAHLTVLSVCDSGTISTVSECSTGIRLTQAVGLFHYEWRELEFFFFTATCRRSRSQRWPVTRESLPVYRLWAWTVSCCSCNLTLHLLVNSNPDMSCRRTGSFSALHSWHCQVSAFWLYVSFSSFLTAVADDSLLTVI